MAPSEQRPDCAAAVDHHKDKSNSSPSTTPQRPVISTGRRRATVDSPHRSDTRQAPPSPSGSVPNYLKATQSSVRQTSVNAPDGYKDKKPPSILKPPANARKLAPPPAEQSKPAVASPTSKTSPKGKPTGGSATSPKHPLLPAHSKPARSGTTSPATMMSPKRILPPSKPRDGASLWKKVKQSKLLAGAGEPKKPHARTRSVSMGSIELRAKATIPRRGGGMKAGAKKEEEAREEQLQPQPQPPPAEEPAPRNNVKALVGAFENVISLRDETTPKDAGDGQRAGHHEAAEGDRVGQRAE